MSVHLVLRERPEADTPGQACRGNVSVEGSTLDPNLCREAQGRVGIRIDIHCWYPTGQKDAKHLPEVLHVR